MTHFSFGDDEATLARYGVHVMTSKGQPARVGTRLCNAWGLFDMHGNVQEWCWDLLGDYNVVAEVEDPRGPSEGPYRVLRGGCYYFTARDCGSSIRLFQEPTYRGNDLGFRVVAVPSGLSSKREVRGAESGSR
jgi:formylglycine-generating enzyme required for sulfatase activity